MIKDYLIDNYGYNEPIFLNDLLVEGISENAVRQSVKRLVACGFLERYDSGIYYIPKSGGLLGKSYLDPSVVIMRKYVENNANKYGYITGLSFANQLGLTTQMPAVIEIVTNREATNGRTLMVGNQKVRVKKSAIPGTGGKVYRIDNRRDSRCFNYLHEKEEVYKETVIRCIVCVNRSNSQKID